MGYHSSSRLVFSTFSSLTNISTHSSCIAFHTQLANHAISYSYKLLFTLTLCARMRSKGRGIALSFSKFVSLFVCGCKNVHVERIRNVYSQFIMKTHTYTYLTNRVICMKICGSKPVLSVQIIKQNHFNISYYHLQ